MELNFKFKRAPTEKWGIHCGAEKSQEWMLPWWWSRYCDHNDFPVTFFDFGMSDEMRRWCETRGEVIAIELDPSLVTPQSQIDPDLVAIWESWHGKNIWKLRANWIKKALSFLYSRYERGIWIDIDCEILGSLKPLFSQCDAASQIALVTEHKTDHLPRFHPETRFNSGVIVFQHGARIVEQWAEGSVLLNGQFAGDDYVLSHLINTQRLNVIELPQIYNWRLTQGMNLDAVIFHWIGKSKAYIRENGGIKSTLENFRKCCGDRHG